MNQGIVFLCLHAVTVKNKNETSLSFKKVLNEAVKLFMLLKLDL